MTVRQPRYSKEELAQRAHEIYESQVKSHVEADNYGKIVAINIETEAFAIADDSLTASKQLLTHNSDAQTFCIRIGHRAVHRFGFNSRTTLV